MTCKHTLREKHLCKDGNVRPGYWKAVTLPKEESWLDYELSDGEFFLCGVIFGACSIGFLWVLSVLVGA